MLTPLLSCAIAYALCSYLLLLSPLGVALEVLDPPRGASIDISSNSLQLARSDNSRFRSNKWLLVHARRVVLFSDLVVPNA